MLALNMNKSLFGEIRMKTLASLLLVVFSNRAKRKYERKRKSKKLIFVKFLAMGNSKGKS
jgi:hypothetical protein